MKSCRCSRAEMLMLVAGLGLLGPAGCGSRSGPPIYPPAVPSDAARKAVELYDTDKNGFLDAAELEKAPALRVAFPNASQVTEEDIAARFASWKENKVGRLQFTIAVHRNGRPLAGATVTLVPESFLGGEFKAATGKTDRAGTASPSVPLDGPDDVPGVPPGFYRIEITKAGENIPAKYNTQTILGGEVPQMDATKWRFDLQY
jgi:hypothetical protein